MPRAAVRHTRSFLVRSAATRAAVTVLVLAVAASPAAGQCTGGSPAFGVDSSLWGSLRPTDSGQVPTFRDSTDYDGLSRPDSRWPLFSSLDVEGTTLYAVYSSGFQIWSIAGADQTNPRRLAARDGWPPLNQFLAWIGGTGSETRELVWDVDVPDGAPGLAALSGIAPIGVEVWNTANPSIPVQLYQDTGHTAYQIYAAKLGGTRYAFAAVEQSTGNGVHVYDLDAALAFPNGCVENPVNEIDCPGVYLGRLGPINSVSYVDGVETPGGRHLIAFSSGVPVRGLELWEVTDPLDAANLKPGGGRYLSNQILYGVALWEHEGGIYLAVIRDQASVRNALIYEVTDCLDGGCPGGSPGTLLWTSPNLTGSSFRWFVTDSKSSGHPYLYLGVEDMCSGGGRRERLYDVGDPAAPVELGVEAGTVDWPNPGGAPDPYPLDYWSWYYSRSPTGFSLVMPRMGRFAGPYFYRAAWTLFDVHELVVPPPDPTLFADGFESGDLGAWSAAEPGA